MSTKQFTDKQIADYHRYEKVRKSDRWNMFSSQAMTAANLARDDYFFVMKNSTELEEQAKAATA